MAGLLRSPCGRPIACLTRDPVRLRAVRVHHPDLHRPLAAAVLTAGVGAQEGDALPIGRPGGRALGLSPVRETCGAAAPDVDDEDLEVAVIVGDSPPVRRQTGWLWGPCVRRLLWEPSASTT